MDRRALIAVIAGSFGFAAPALAAPPWKQERPANAAGREAFEAERYEDAAKRFETLEDELAGDDKAKAAFNRGDALYQSGDLEGAERAFDRAAEGAKGRVRADALFNQGLAREGQQNMRGAIEAYRDALLTEPEHAGARQNLERLLRLPPPPPQQQQQQSQSQSDEQKKQEGQPPPKPKDGENQDQAQQDPAQGKQEQQPPKEDSAQPPSSGKLTEKEADDILRSAEQEKQGQRLLQTGKPPPDFDPQKDW